MPKNKILPVKLISGLLSADEVLLDNAKQLLCKKFGQIDAESPVVPFDFTHYYDEELGKGILRQYVSFKKLIRPEDIGKIKRQTIRLEKKMSVKGDNKAHPPKPWRRRVNIDPGFVSLAKLVLATTKDATYRMYIGKGIYAESTLFFKDGTFTEWPWSYRDYKSEIGIKFFNNVREIYRKTISTM
jgi:hypothetical protein